MNHKEIMTKCVNSFGTHDHPMPDTESIEFFDKDYVIECLCKALTWEKVNPTKSDIEDIVADLLEHKNDVTESSTVSSHPMGELYPDIVALFEHFLFTVGKSKVSS
jgi:hypothetical protein|tara:strand:+ start:2522 stop:2839 length:318 start_codon:yes stop_codon:yes gene_type:complete